jgi:hypothetical protein
MNGYRNYETWAVSLWLDNDEGTCDYIHELANDRTVSDSAKAEALKESVIDTVPDLGATMCADLLGAALQVVEWHEIIESHIEDTMPRLRHGESVRIANEEIAQ